MCWPCSLRIKWAVGGWFRGRSAFPPIEEHNKLVTPGGGCEEQAKSYGGINRRKEKRKKEERKTVEGASRFVRRIVTQRRNDASVCADRVV